MQRVSFAPIGNSRFAQAGGNVEFGSKEKSVNSSDLSDRSLRSAQVFSPISLQQPDAETLGYVLVTAKQLSDLSAVEESFLDLRDSAYREVSRHRCLKHNGAQLKTRERENDSFWPMAKVSW
jgi:hypothetical protein